MLPSGPTALNTAFYREGGVVFILFFFHRRQSGRDFVLVCFLFFCIYACKTVGTWRIPEQASRQALEDVKTDRHVNTLRLLLLLLLVEW